MPNSLARAIIVLLLSGVLLGQSPQDRPTFRSGVQYIEVDVMVTDEDGNAVRGLTKDDFTLLEDDVAQPITNFSFVDLPIEAPASRKAAAAATEPDVVTNTGEGRMYVVALNRSTHRHRLIARRFVEEAVGPDDQIAVVHVCGNMSAAQGFTSNRHLMLAAIDRILLGADGGGSCEMTTNFEVLEELSERLGLINGRRKVVLWFDPPSLFIPDFQNDPRAAGNMFAQRDALRAATRNNVALYVISTDGLTTELGLGSLEGKAGLQVLAADTGGDIIVGTNNFSPGFQRFVRDNSAYYLLGYEPAVQHRDGKFHNLAVRVNRRDVTVRARRGYYAPEADAAVAPPPAVVAGLSADTVEALRIPSSTGALGIDLVAMPFRGATRQGSVLLSAQLRGADLVLGAGEQIEIAYQGMTTEGKVTPGAFKVFTLDFAPESRAEVARTGIRLVDRLEMSRGRHQVRFAVHQANGKTGSVVADVEIPDYAGPPVMSGVVFASEETRSHRTLLGDATLSSILASEPTAVRRFSRRDVLSAFVEVYAALPQAAEATRVTARLTPAGGGRARTQAVTVVRGEPGRVGHLVRVRLADLSPGEYVLTFQAALGGRQETRQVPFTVLHD
jgi:VWFA-related protein